MGWEGGEVRAGQGGEGERPMGGTGAAGQHDGGVCPGHMGPGGGDARGRSKTMATAGRESQDQVWSGGAWAG